MKKTNDPEFDVFWQAYPNKRDKIGAISAWRRLSKKDRKAAMTALPAFITDCKAEGRAFVYAVRYLTHRRWEDDFTSSPGCVGGNTIAAPAKATAAPSPTPTNINPLSGMEEW